MRYKNNNSHLKYGESFKIKFMRRQQVLSEPGRLFVKQYTTKSGQVKNKYILNKNAKVIKTITHLK